MAVSDQRRRVPDVPPCLAQIVEGVEGRPVTVGPGVAHLVTGVAARLELGHVAEVERQDLVEPVGLVLAIDARVQRHVTVELLLRDDEGFTLVPVPRAVARHGRRVHVPAPRLGGRALEPVHRVPALVDLVVDVELAVLVDAIAQLGRAGVDAGERVVAVVSPERRGVVPVVVEVVIDRSAAGSVAEVVATAVGGAVRLDVAVDPVGGGRTVHLAHGVAVDEVAVAADGRPVDQDVVADHRVRDHRAVGVPGDDAGQVEERGAGEPVTVVPGGHVGRPDLRAGHAGIELDAHLDGVVDHHDGVAALAVLVDPVAGDVEGAGVDGGAAVVAVVPAVRDGIEAVVVDVEVQQGVGAAAVFVHAVARDVRGAGVDVVVGVVAIRTDVEAVVVAVEVDDTVAARAVVVDAVAGDLGSSGVDGRVGVVAVVATEILVVEPVVVGVEVREGVAAVAVLVDPVAGDVEGAGMHGGTPVVAVVAAGGLVVEAVVVLVVVDRVGVGVGVRIRIGIGVGVAVGIGVRVGVAEGVAPAGLAEGLVVAAHGLVGGLRGGLETADQGQGEQDGEHGVLQVHDNSKRLNA